MMLLFLGALPPDPGGSAPRPPGFSALFYQNGWFSLFRFWHLQYNGGA